MKISANCLCGTKLGNAYTRTTKGIGNAISGVFGKAKTAVSEAFETKPGEEHLTEEDFAEEGEQMNNFINFYTKMSYIKSMIVRFTIIIVVLIILASAAFSQETPNPSPTVTPTPEQTETPGDIIVSPTPLPTPTPVISPPAPEPPTDMPNLNDNPPELPDIPPAPPLDIPDYSNTPRPLPAPDRVGVDLADQTPLALEDAIRMALENNNDIEIAGSDVKSAEFDLTIAERRI